jgi:hypothetical protein
MDPGASTRLNLHILTTAQNSLCSLQIEGIGSSACSGAVHNCKRYVIHPPAQMQHKMSNW